MDVVDVTGNGSPDIALCHNYGDRMFNCDKDKDGATSWLRHPGSMEGAWKPHSVDTLIATHRVRFGRFTGRAARELAAFPVVGPQGGRAGLGTFDGKRAQGDP